MYQITTKTPEKKNFRANDCCIFSILLHSANTRLGARSNTVSLNQDILLIQSLCFTIYARCPLYVYVNFGLQRGDQLVRDINQSILEITSSHKV